jgi:hypothetical protein
MTSRVSPIFSLGDPVEITSEGLTFEQLGESYEGYHVAVTFKPIVKVLLHVDVKSPVTLNRFCTLYNLVNKRGTVYGYLFVLDRERLTIINNRMIVRCDDTEAIDFNVLSIANEKHRMLFYRSSSGCLLVVIIGKEKSDYLVYEV